MQAETLRERELIPANEHITMQTESQVYGIQTAAHGLCLTSQWQLREYCQGNKSECYRGVEYHLSPRLSIR